MVNTKNRVEFSRWIEENCPSLDNTNSKTNRKLIYGVGTNDANYTVNINIDGERYMDPAYQAWHSMLSRAISPTTKNKNPTYTNVMVCEEWLLFSNFRRWWLENYKEGFHLDNDILKPNNNIYAPKTCVYVPQWLNTFITDRKRARGKYKIGLYLDAQRGKYRAKCRNPITNKSECLGRFSSEEEAHEAWLNRKLEIAKLLKNEMDNIHINIYPNICLIINNMI